LSHQPKKIQKIESDAPARIDHSQRKTLCQAPRVQCQTWTIVQPSINLDQLSSY